MKVTHNDGGRASSGFLGTTGDCVTRSIAIATEIPYREVYDSLNALAKRERLGTRKKGKSSSRTGVYRSTYQKYLESLGWTWVPTMHIGSGCKVHLREGELPMGRLIVTVSRHMVAVIDNVIHDLSDPSRNGWRCVYGYFHKPQPYKKNQVKLQEVIPK